MPRLDTIYLALQTLRAQELYKALGDEKTFPVDRNTLIRELAKIVDDALAEEVRRRGERF